MAEFELAKDADQFSGIKYHDRWLIIVGIPLINVLNYYLTYPNIRADAHTILTFSIDTLEGYLAWYAGRAVVRVFDKKYPWEIAGWRRLLLQIPLVAVAVLSVIVSLTELINAIATDKPVPVDFYKHDIFLFVIWSFVLNGVYLGIYLYQKVTRPKEIEVENTNSNPFIITKTGNKQKVIYLREMKCFFIEHDYVRAVSDQNSQIISDFTLEKLASLLEPVHFFRANRQYIITREIVQQVIREKDGKLVLTLIKLNGLPESITISRLRATAFKQWLNDSSLK
ncbi:hypothetical protein AHMF7605_01305 [Adhaeribacter arboris]|uniref:HTH LytTR-type domain-containing protein n=1 Tax=Adhaeribacter arboris TaxID=2072846 RepID=A0A2T2Y9S5_9BACT|nr:LytTR family DNA-binding domain-containing protein [Adhaeribacter arboris]PSR52253.1 hypothetical protein AHMF7605_01305 [Adhaeribacter arboris]